MKYVPAGGRCASMRYNRCGRSDIQLPAVSPGLWHNFGWILCEELAGYRDQIVIPSKADSLT